MQRVDRERFTQSFLGRLFEDHGVFYENFSQLALSSRSAETLTIQKQWATQSETEMDNQDRRTDAELVEAACKGDVESFRCLYERHYRLAMGIALSRLRDRHLAEDVAQEAFAIACRKLHTLSKTNRFPEWFGTICRRTAGKMSMKQMYVVPLEEHSVTHSSRETDTSKNDDVRDALEKLPVSARELLALHYFSGLSHEEIALSLGISSQAVHGRLQRARKMLVVHLPHELRKGISND